MECGLADESGQRSLLSETKLTFTKATHTNSTPGIASSLWVVHEMVMPRLHDRGVLVSIELMHIPKMRMSGFPMHAMATDSLLLMPPESSEDFLLAASKRLT